MKNILLLLGLIMSTILFAQQTLSNKWSAPETLYRDEMKMELGNVGFAHVIESGTINEIVVANMIAQSNIKRNLTSEDKPPIRYDALIDCLIKVNAFCTITESSLHMPRIGSDRAGGDWKIIERLIEHYISVPTIVYDLKPHNNVQYQTENTIEF